MFDSPGCEKALQSCDTVDVRPLKLSEIWRASKTWAKAMVGDPYMGYLHADGRPVPLKVWTITYVAMLALWIGEVPIFTAEGGSSLCIGYNPPSRPRTRLTTLKHKVAIKLYVAAMGRKTKEQQKRWNESQEKEAAVFNKAFPPEEFKEMYIVMQMATDPKYQGRGLGSATLQAMTAIADEEHRACWLSSSNVANNAFYNYNGFFTVAQFTVGDDNPSWDKKPVLVQVMLREPKGGRRTFEQTSPSSEFSSLIKTGDLRVPLAMRF